MRSILREKAVIFVGIAAVFLFAAGCQQSRMISNDIKLPSGAVGAITFQGKGIVLYDKQGRPVQPKKIDLTKAKKIGSSVTFTQYKVNPCVIERCTDTGCDTYVYDQLPTCPPWW